MKTTKAHADRLYKVYCKANDKLNDAKERMVKAERELRAAEAEKIRAYHNFAKADAARLAG